MKNLSRPLTIAVKDITIDVKADVLILFLFEKEIISREILLLDKKLDNAIQLLIKSKDFTGIKNSVYTFQTNNKIKASRVMLVGLGNKEKTSNETMRQAVASAILNLKNTTHQNIALLVPSVSDMQRQNIGQIFSETIILTTYEFNRHKREKKNSFAFKQIIILTAKRDLKNIANSVKTGEIIARSVCVARDLANEPGNLMTPSTLAQSARDIALKHKLTCQILEEKDMKKLGMGALLGVAKGTEEPAKFIILDYKPKKLLTKTNKKIPTIILIGKGLTFDSGGLSLKPSQNMDEMKFDMAGGAVAIAAIQAVAQLDLPVRLISLIPSTENMPSGSAQRPGDIVRAMNGKTIEILNTDAEGRLILADALVYAKKYNPDLVIDFATLTGAIIVALGNKVAGLFSNNEKLSQVLIKSGETTGERVWPMPLFEEYFDQIKGDMADIKNTGGKEAGSITAAKFLEQFVDFPWAHLDIAGTASTSQSKFYQTKGASGFGIRLIIEAIKAYL